MIPDEADQPNLTIDPTSITSSAKGGTLELTTDSDNNPIVTYTPPDGYVGPDSFTYAVTDGTATSLPATVNIEVDPAPPSDPQPDEYALLYVAQGTSVRLPWSQEQTGSKPQFSHGDVTDSGDGWWVYTPNPTFVGLDSAAGQFAPPDKPTYKVDIVVEPANLALTPWRSGLKTDHQVLKATKAQNDPADYVILTNNNFDEQHTDGSPDNANDVAKDANGDSMVATDKDLARIDVTIPDDATEGSVTLSASDSSAVRFFKADGTELSSDDMTVDLSNRSGYLAYGGTVWVEGLQPNADETISLVFKNKNGAEVARDDVHMDVVQWDFIDANGNSTSFVPSVWGDGLVAAAARPVAPLADPDGALFKTRIQGLAQGISDVVTARSSSNAADGFNDAPDPSAPAGTFLSKKPLILYSGEPAYEAPDSPILSAAERAGVTGAFAIDPLHNSAGTITLTIGNAANPRDRLIRTITTLKLKMDLTSTVVQAGQPISGYITRVDNTAVGSYRISVNIPGQPPQISENDATDFPFEVTPTQTGDVTLRVRVNGKFITSLVVHVLGPGDRWSTWHQAAWDALSVEGSVPEDPINRNRRITELYAQLYNNGFTPGNAPLNPFEWFGMAAFASRAAGDGMQQAELHSWVDIPNFPDLGDVVRGLADGNIAIFLDMYPQGLAYQSGGIAAIHAMRQKGLIIRSQELAWEDIDNGMKNGDRSLIWRGTYGLADVEQRITLQTVLNRNPELWQRMTDNWLSSFFPIESPFPGNMWDFQTYRMYGQDVPRDASFADANARMNWFTDILLPGWKDGWRANNTTIDVQVLLDGGYSWK